MTNSFLLVIKTNSYHYYCRNYVHYFGECNFEIILNLSTIENNETNKC